ncbi:flavin-containing monooxygenase [Antarcticimicrobium sediminis]|uniref:NAD(P)/FAD-dependent oxidoreductase n=1 Tax=Antarcticimicrobium sediminis TaxID=2546227 RepID=A0A4R5EJE5_9RHOB|nr:NAD(P)/FAD-dependent oxidoreductase [Antarcticimicrobium sediminis]TDE34659.1 NAD(P)/FAD-dependent oxidoreductase [Antarcticimicrobium sediminis]
MYNGTIDHSQLAPDLLSGFDAIAPLDADDATLAAAVEEAELPALLATLSVLTGKPELLSEDLTPPTPPMLMRIAPQGGMSEATQAKARKLALSTLIEARDTGWPQIRPTVQALQDAISFLTRGAGGAGEDYLGLLMHEIGLPEDTGKPDWTAETLAPGRDLRVAVIGGGLAGIAAAYRLSQAGLDFTVYEKNPEIGGVWWNNTYPGCRLDTPNFAYSFSFAQKPDWPQQFSERSEVFGYAKRVAEDAGLRSNFTFSTEVESMRWDEAKGGWWLHTRGPEGEKIEFAHVVIPAVGHLNRPNIPEIPGQNEFRGRAVHSAEWPSDLDLTGKRVAVIGTGASGFQIVPAIADQVSALTVFQRNPAWMLSTPNYQDDIKPGMHWLLTHVPYYGRWFRFWQFWIAAEGRFPAITVDPEWKHPISVSELNEKLRLGCIENLTAQVGDRKDLLEKLTPAYPPGAKRMVRDNGAYVNTLKKPHVSLVSEKIVRLTPQGIVTADGAHHDVDVIVYATGFLAADYLDPIRIEGRGERVLHDFWSGDCRAYLGIAVPSFPNLFIIGGPNSGLVVNGSAIFTSECALEYVLRSIEYMLENDVKSAEVRQESYDAFNEDVDHHNQLRAWGTTKVNTWYQGRSGRPTVTWPHPILEYYKRTSVFDDADYTLSSRG